MGKGSSSGHHHNKQPQRYYLRGGHAPPPRGLTGTEVSQYHSRKHLHGRYGNRTGSKKLKEEIQNHLPKGLLNVGNTCYANAALQCLLSTALTHALICPKASAIFRRYSSNPNLLEQGSGSVDSNEGVAFGELTALEKQRISNKEKQRKEQCQHDRRMQENCRWLTRELKSITLEYLHENESRSSVQQQSPFAGWLSPSPTPVVDPGSITRHPDRLSKCLRPYQQEDAHEFLRAMLSTLVMNGQNKQLSSLFDGLLESAVTCLHCHRPSLTRDRYMDLSLDICADHVQSLHDALDEFTKTETLSGDNKVFCQKCSVKRPATKGLRLATAPSILVCHLKRFAFDPYGRLVRLNKRVDIPLRLEIGDYMSRVNKARPPPYELVAVLVHQGHSCDSGHYLAYVKNSGTWYKCNDSLVEPVSVETVLDQQAYILLYEVEEMRSKNGYSSPSGGKRSSSRSPANDSNDWMPFLNGWREYLFSTSLCGMDDSFLRDICWDSNYPRPGKTDSSASKGNSANTRSLSSRRRTRVRDGASRSSVDSHHDAHDDLSTLGESTVESTDTGKIPFRRISSSGNLKSYDRYRHHSGAHHSAGRPRQHFFPNTSNPELLARDDSLRGASKQYPSSAPRSRNDLLPPRPETATPATVEPPPHRRAFSSPNESRSMSEGGKFF